MKRFRNFFLFLICISSFIPASSQTNKILRKEFYGLNINTSCKKIINKLKKDDRFTPSGFKYNRHTFFYNSYQTRIRDQYLPSSPIRPDSAEITLSYSSNGLDMITNIKTIYYFHKKSEEEDFLQSIWNRIKHIPDETADADLGDVTVGYKNRNDFQYGKSIYFHKGAGPRVHLLQNDRSDSLFVISLEYERKGY